MKKRTKKAIIIGSSTVIVAGVVASIAVPLVSIYSQPEFNYQSKDKLYDDVLGETVEQTLNKQGQQEKIQLDKFDYQVAFYLYDFEQKGSLELQKQHFNWDIYELKLKIEAEKEKVEEKQSVIEERIRGYQDDIRKIEDKLSALNREIGAAEGLDYERDRFASEYPKVLLPLEKVRQKRETVYNDSKENYVSKFSTRQEGLNAWPDERRRLYNNAATDKEAVDYLTHKEISENSFAQFKFKINSDYTYEQKRAQVDGQPIFSFLKDAVEKKYDETEAPPLEEVEDTRKKEKVYFTGTNSRIPSRLAINFSSEGQQSEDALIREVLSQNLIKVNHALIAAKQNNSGSSLPWTFEKDKNVVKNLLSFFDRGERRVLELVPNLFATGSGESEASNQEEVEKDTAIFIDFFSNDDSGKTKYGSLGIRTVTDYVKEMVPGFSFGILAILNSPELPSDDPRNGKNYLQDLVENIEKGAQEAWKDDQPTNQKDLVEALNNLGDADTQRIFGKSFRDTFDPEKDGLELYYPAGEGAHVVISKNGVHAVKVTSFDEPAKIKAEIERDLTQVAQDQEVNKAETNWSNLFNNHFTQHFRIDFIIREYNQGDALKNFVLEQDKEINWNDIVRLVGSMKNANSWESANNALGKKVKEFYIDSIDKELRTIDPTLRPEEVYNVLIKETILPTREENDA
ncbi:hypothetical protein [Mycoplasma sp. ATU-Cv-508]|uniref:hypothetical protein n=1 Tax=Mycoplasma sp. ATU-Cv-508 TaxID=2048001 RepID=UPI000FDDCE22